MLDNRNRLYALASWTVKSNGKNWFLRKTDSFEEWRGPYRNETNVRLTIARHLKKELIKRDGLYPPL